MLNIPTVTERPEVKDLLTKKTSEGLQATAILTHDCIKHTLYKPAKGSQAKGIDECLETRVARFRWYLLDSGQ
jgi:hypothetical protein